MTVFFGWKVIAAACVIATCAFGFGYFGPAVFLDVLHTQHGWPVSLISAAITVHFLVSALLVPYLPDAHDRFGIAPVTLAGVAVLLVGVLGWSLAVDRRGNCSSQRCRVVTGWAATSGAAIVAMVSPWFDRRRALGLGLALNGASIGGILFAPLWVFVISVDRLRQAAVLFGVATLAITRTVDLAISAADAGKSGVGAGRRCRAIRGASAPRRANPRPRASPHSCESRPFVTLSIAFALGLFAQVGITAHIVTRLAPLVGADYAAGAISLQTACAMLGRVFLGALLGRADRRFVAAGNFAVQACGVSLLAVGSTAIVLVPGCILFGLGIGSLLLLPPLIAQRDFAPIDVPRVVALVTATNQAVLAFAPAALGVLRELSGSYALPFLTAAGIQLLAGVIVVLGRGRAWR